MTAADYIIVGAAAAAFVRCGLFLLRRKKKNRCRGCRGGCAGCPYSR